MISIICDEFHCTPDVALKLDVQLVLNIIEYRRAMEAKQMHNENVELLAKYPGHVRLWKELANSLQGENDG